MSQNPFSIANRRFTNLESATVQVVRFRFAPARQFLDSVTSVFRTIDFDDDYQAELGRNLWRLRCSVLFGLAPYDHEELGLLTQGEQILGMAKGLPGSRESTTQMLDRLSVLLDQTDNPKLEWVARQGWGHDDPAAIFALMAMRKSFGSDLIAQLPGNPANPPQIISSLEQIGTGKYATLVIPGTCQYLSQGLFMKLFHLGEYSRVHVLLYEGETFRPKDRLRLPESTLLLGCSEGKDLHIERSDVVDSTDAVDGDVDKFISDGLFSPPCDASLDDGRGIPSRFVLCDGGKGFYVAEAERIRVWRQSESDILIPLYPAQLSEGDFVILEKGDRSEFLDQAGDQQEFEAGLDATSVWRTPLQELLLSRSLEKVANLMSETRHIPERTAGLTAFEKADKSDLDPFLEGLTESARASRNLQSTLRNWAEGRVYGPRDLQHMRALVQVLVDGGALNLDSSPEEAAERWFRELERLRAGRRAAGMHVRDEIDHLLEDTLGGSVSPTDGLEIELANGMVISLHQLAMIGDRVSRVPESSLRKLI
jgi:hypothetical protein